jgi:ketosteroid isomerase-like protein
MTISLPEPIAAYFKASNDADDARLVPCFAQDAIVRDESHTHQGHEAIRRWLREAKRKYEYSVEPLSVAQDGAHVTVAGKVSGNFPGSPVQLDYVFELRDGKIQSLEIH